MDQLQRILCRVDIWSIREGRSEHKPSWVPECWRSQLWHGRFLYSELVNGTLFTKISNFLNIDSYLCKTCVSSAKDQKNGATYDHNLLEVSYCPYDCDDKLTVCIPKCCPMGHSILHDNKDHWLACEPSGNNIWKGFLYNKNGNRIGIPGLSQKYKYDRKHIDCCKRQRRSLTPRHGSSTFPTNCSSEYWHPMGKISNDTQGKQS